ncbi:hypothetical protein NQ314_001800 [Rhamnusium bicolor]|uniref:Uncharacterized protein n=1 Tax=Rhamnusium bicolor TaxID=1586634 RepID=A0AAV8ZRR9_9CUCU|nr:hypothetical protein NQ314_001800 [Rhamnusium bicolor]
MPQDILHGLEVVRETQPFLFLFSDLRVIDDMYDKFRRYQKSSLNKNKYGESRYNQELMISHITNDVLYDPKININKTVTNIFKQIFSSNSENMILKLFDIISDSDYFCKHTSQPPQQVFYNLYNTIGLIELKGYIMTQFSYMALRLDERGNYTEASQFARKQFEKRANDTVSTLHGVMDFIQGKLWRCDPKVHVKGNTYEELTGLLQGYIENEVDLNKAGTCKESCWAYSKAENHGCYDWESEHCRKRKPCFGKIWSCRFVESHMKTCNSVSGSDGLFIAHIAYVLCDQQGPHSDRYFNLRPVMADVANNRVVTGLRIVKNNRLIHLQIQEGKLLPYGYIDNNTIRWVPVDDYKITDKGVQNGEDFHTMSYEHRTMLLDDLKPIEANHIITGVKFDFIDNHLRFEINARAFDFKYGTLSNDSYYIHGVLPRQHLNIDDPDIPTESPKSIPNWEQNLYIEFTHTSFDKDAAQTTIPFFDTQPVASYPAVPLKGAGIYYKGFKGYGGFVAPKITTYDFSKHLKTEFPKSQIREDSEEAFDPLIN